MEVVAVFALFAPVSFEQLAKVILVIVVVKFVREELLKR
jgi:hypothetical protein